MNLDIFIISKEYEESINGRVLGNRGESFVIVLPSMLSETFGTKASLVEVIGILDMENPARFDDFCIIGLRDESSSTVLHYLIIFFLYSKLSLFCILGIHSHFQFPLMMALNALVIILRER